MSNLVGDIRGLGELSEDEHETFLEKIEALMRKYNIDRIDVGWSIRAAMTCEKCPDPQ